MVGGWVSRPRLVALASGASSEGTELVRHRCLLLKARSHDGSVSHVHAPCGSEGSSHAVLCQPASAWFTVVGPVWRETEGLASKLVPPVGTMRDGRLPRSPDGPAEGTESAQEDSPSRCVTESGH